MKIAITGASGHIGANLCRELLGQGHEVRILVRKFTGSLPDTGLTRIEGDLLDPGSLCRLAEGSDVLIHLAASISIDGSQEVLKTNVEGTRHVIRACRECRVKRLVHFSSIHALLQDPLDKMLDETRPLALEDPILYTRSKAMAEQLVRQAASGGLDTVIINPTSVMGPNDFKPSLIGQAILQLCQGKLPALIPGGYDWVDVRDVVSGTLAALEKGRSGESYLLSGHFVSLTDLYSQIRAIRGSGKNLPLIPFWLAELGVPFLKLWSLITRSKPLYTRESIDILRTAHRRISHEKASREFGYEPRPFKDTLVDTLRWFEKNHYLQSR